MPCEMPHHHHVIIRCWPVPCLLAWLLLPIAAAVAGGEAPQGVEHVFIVSFDGAGGLPEVVSGRKNMPEFKRMAEEGAVSWSAQTIFPSITLPSHTSMLTGVGPKKHQVTWNDWIPENGLVKVPTVFSLAKARGLKTGMFVGKSKFHHLELPGTVDVFVWPEPKAGAPEVAAAFVSNVGTLKPGMCFIHFADPDKTGHKFGWGSPEQAAALADCDQALKSICRAIADAGLMESSVILLTADHGGHEKTHGSDRPEDMTIPWVVWGKGVKKHSVLTQPIHTVDTAATALWLLGIPLPPEMEGKPVKEAFEP